MSIQNDIDAAPPGGTVNVPPGTYNEQIIIDKPLTLSGPTPPLGEAIIDASGLIADTATIHILANDVVVENLTLQNGPGQGIRAGDTTFTNLTGIIIRNNIIRDHDRAGVLTANSASMQVEDNTIVDNGKMIGFQRTGVYLYPHGESSVRRNIIKNNFGDGIFARESNSGLLIEDNKIEDHTNSGITLAWDEINVTIRNNEISDCGQGNFDEQGGIVIIQSMAENITGNTIQNCNRSGIFWGWTPTSGPPPPQILIAGNTIDGSARDAIYLFSMGPGGWIPADPFPLEPDVLDNRLLNSGRAGVYVSYFYYYSPGNAKPTIHNNTILGNMEYGVFNGTAAEVDATNNWWGSSSGPFHPVSNPEGSGDPVSDRVLFSPWLTLPPPQGIACLVMEKVYDQCYSEDVVVKTFAIPAEILSACNNNGPGSIDRLDCAIVTAQCSVVDVGPPLNDNQRSVTVQQKFKIRIDLINERANPPIVLSFDTPLDHFHSQALLDVPPPGAIFGPAGGPFVSCQVVSSACLCKLETPPPGETITKVICTVKMCKIIEVSAFVKLLVPHMGYCTPEPCHVPPHQEEIECPPIDELFPSGPPLNAGGT
ncbi:MAG TPA: DUF1565 domain-containing protein [Firmicutes bacterium]|nr:DUF1565 domain-containing protein [Bacillota bacterium]